MRARLALAVSGQACELREVVLKAKPAELLAASPKASVPVLVLTNGEVIDQSLDIMRWALGHSDPAQWLPKEAQAAQVLAIIEDCEQTFKHHLDRYKYPGRYAQTDPEWFAEQDWPGLRTWLKAIVTSALFESVMHKYPPWQSGAEAVVFAPDLANLKV